MARSRRSASTEQALPPCYAMCQSGLEPIVADEITREVGGDVKKSSRGFVVFRTDRIDEKLLHLRTTEDVYLLAWGSDSLTFKAADLKTITQWTARQPNWEQMIALHQQVKGPPKARPTFHLVCQMQGEHGYRRVDALDALADGLAGKIPGAWVPKDENAYFEVWLTIHGKTAVCGVRLSDRTMRHRTYKHEHIAASLRPTVAAAMVRMAGAGPGMTLLDPFCGAGTILAEQLQLSEQRKAGAVQLLGGDEDAQAVYCAQQNLKGLGEVVLCRWDVRALPLASGVIDRIVTNPPFGKQLATLEEIEPLYRAAAREWNRVLKPGGRAVLLVAEQDTLRAALAPHHWQPVRQYKVRVLGQAAVLSVWQKP